MRPPEGGVQASRRMGVGERVRKLGGPKAGRSASAVTSVAARLGAGGLVAAGRRDRVVVACGRAGHGRVEVAG